MKYCSKHHENPNDAIFCAECGEKLKGPQLSKSKKCPKCAANNPQDAEFCHYCGYKFSEPIITNLNTDLAQGTANPAERDSTNSTSSEEIPFFLRIFIIIGLLYIGWCYFDLLIDLWAFLKMIF